MRHLCLFAALRVCVKNLLHLALITPVTGAIVFIAEILPLWLILAGTSALCLAYFTTVLVRAARAYQERRVWGGERETLFKGSSLAGQHRVLAASRGRRA